MILRLLIALVMILLTIPSIAGAQDIFQREKGLYSTRDLTAKSGVAGRKRVLIRSTSNLEGHLQVFAGEGNEVSAVYTKQARTDSRSRAFDYIDLMSVNVDLLPDYIRVDLRAPNPAPWDRQTESGLIELRLTVPAGMAIEVDAIYFDIEAEGPFSQFLVPSSLGRLNVMDVTQQLELSTANRRIEIQDISGAIRVKTSNSTITASNIRSGSSAAQFRNDGGEIRIENVTGEINVKNGFGRIEISEFTVTGTGNFIRNTSAPILIDVREMNEGQLVIDNRYDDIELNFPASISAYFSLSVEEDGIIEASNFVFQTDLVKPNRLTFHSGEGDVSIKGSVRGKGNIYVRGIERELDDE